MFRCSSGMEVHAPQTFTSPTGLNAAISAADVASAAMVPVTVFTLTDGRRRKARRTR